MPLLSCYVYTVCELLKVARPWLHLGEITVLACWGGGLELKIPRCYLFVLEVTWSPAVVIALTERPTWRKRAVHLFSPHMHQARMLESHTHWLQAMLGSATHLLGQGLCRGSFYFYHVDISQIASNTCTWFVGNSRVWTLKEISAWLGLSQIYFDIDDKFIGLVGMKLKFVYVLNASYCDLIVNDSPMYKF